MLTVEEQIRRDLGKKKVRFAYPGVEGVLQGTLKDRCVIAAGNNIGGVPYWDVTSLSSKVRVNRISCVLAIIANRSID